VSVPGLRRRWDRRSWGRSRRFASRDGLSDDQAERLEEAARHTRRLSIAGAKLGLARVPDGMLDPFLPAIGNVIRGDGGTSTRQRELLEQLRVVEIMFGSDTPRSSSRTCAA
jgi:hypothetical protein